MMYFTRTVPDIRDGQQVEFAISIDDNAAHVERLETQGFARCSIDVFREAWRKKDAQAFERMRAAALLAHASNA